MDLSIIIVNYNVKEYLVKCLESIFRTTREIVFEIVVIDNASSDGSISAVKEKFPQVKLIGNSGNVGFARANNQGIKLAEGKYILLLNPDTEVLRGSISKMVQFLGENDKAGICSATLLNPDHSVQNSGYRFPTLSILFKSSILGAYSVLPISSSHPTEVDWVQGACMMVRKEVFQGVGYLDENFFMYGEEKDLCFRAKKAGWKVFSLPDCKIIHHGSKSTADCEAEAFVEYHKNQVFFFCKHYPHYFIIFAKLIIFTGLLTKAILLSLAFPAKNRKNKLRNFANVLKWYLKEGVRV